MCLGKILYKLYNCDTKEGTFAHRKWHLSPLSHLKCFERPAAPFQLTLAMAFWAGVWSASLFPVQTESHKRKLCLLSCHIVGALWSLKAAETHVWYFCFYLVWTFQVDLKKNQVLTDLNRNAHIQIWFSQCQAQWCERIQINWFPLTLGKWKADLLFQQRLFSWIV